MYKRHKTLNSLKMRSNLLIIKNLNFKIHLNYVVWHKGYIPTGMGKFFLNCKNHLCIVNKDIFCESQISGKCYKGSLFGIITNIKNTELDFLNNGLINKNIISDGCKENHTSGIKNLLFFPDNSNSTIQTDKYNAYLLKHAKIVAKLDVNRCSTIDLNNIKPYDTIFSANEVCFNITNTNLHLKNSLNVYMVSGFEEAGNPLVIQNWMEQLSITAIESL